MSESVGDIVGALTAYCVDPPSPGFCSAVMNIAANSKHSPTAATPQNAAMRLFLSVEFIAVLQFVVRPGCMGTLITNRRPAAGLLG